MRPLALGVLGALILGSVALAQSQPPYQPEFLGVGTGTKTATATAGAATLSKAAGTVTSEALTTAAAATYTLTITNTVVAAADQVFASVANGTNSAGSPVIQTVTPGAGSLVVVVRNSHASAAFNGTIKVSFLVLKN
jgi:hypothetical protein